VLSEDGQRRCLTVRRIDTSGAILGGIFGDAGSCGGVGGAAASVSVSEGVFSDLVCRRGLPAGWWDAGVSVA